jgi:hypothetical protein
MTQIKLSVNKKIQINNNGKHPKGRYAGMEAFCLGCERWLCALNALYTGRVECDHCGAANVFFNSRKPTHIEGAGL